jgi:hypothetical protein
LKYVFITIITDNINFISGIKKHVSKPTTPILPEHHASKPTTPVSSTQYVSRPTSPITNDEQRFEYQQSIVASEHNNILDHPQEKSVVQLDNDKQFEKMFEKQSKQIRALYEMHKETNKRLVWIQSQMKKLIENKNKELSDKVFNVSNFNLRNIISHLNIYR